MPLGLLGELIGLKYMQNRNHKQAHKYRRLFYHIYYLSAKAHLSVKFKVSGTKLKTKKKNIQNTFTKVPKIFFQEKLAGLFWDSIHTQFTYSEREHWFLCIKQMINSALLSAGILTETNRELMMEIKNLSTPAGDWKNVAHWEHSLSGKQLNTNQQLIKASQCHVLLH